MAKIKREVKLKTVGDVEHFVKDMNTFIKDVNIYDGHQVFDAKSLVGVMNLQLGKNYKVELISDDKLAQELFALVVSKYGG